MSQCGQVGIVPVVQLPARDAQVEVEPGRVRRRVARPRHFLKAFHLTDAHTHREKQEQGTCRMVSHASLGSRVTFQLAGMSTSSKF